jgi:hypothetical protein
LMEMFRDASCCLVRRTMAPGAAAVVGRPISAHRQCSNCCVHDRAVQCMARYPALRRTLMRMVNLSIASRADLGVVAVGFAAKAEIDWDDRSYAWRRHSAAGRQSGRDAGRVWADSRMLRARCATGRWMNSPLGSCAAAPPAWSKAASTCRAQVTSSASGSNAAWTIGNWAGWMADLPNRPRARLAVASRCNPLQSLMCG